jgi:hypothetical protein
VELAIIQNHLETLNGRTKSAYLDIEAAYDSVPFTTLMDTLQKRQCPKMVQELIYSLYCRELTSVICVNGEEALEPVKRERGLMQGAILSPFLFNLVLDELITKLDTVEGLCTIAFADDVMLKAADTHKIQRGLEIVHEWARETSMTVSTSKSVVVGLEEDEQTTLGDTALKKVVKAKHLGTWASANGVDFAERGARNLEKAKASLTQLKNGTATWSPGLKLHVVKEQCLSQIEFCRGSWVAFGRTNRGYVDQVKAEMEEVHANMLNFVIGGGNKDAKINERITGLIDPTMRNNYAQTRLNERIREKKEKFPDFARSLAMANAARIPFAENITDSALKREWERERIGLETLKAFIHKKWERSTTSNFLTAAIMPTARSPGGMDSSLVGSPVEQQRKVAWRKNYFGVTRTCPKCGERFNRAHVERCKLIENNSIYRLAKARPELEIQKRKVAQVVDSQTKKRKRSKTPNQMHYTPIDMLLNLKRHAEVDKILEQLEKILETQ